jgi:hypothetical protein
MFARCLLLIVIASLSISCSSINHKKNPLTLMHSEKQSKQYRKITAFTQINAKGLINLNLHTGYKQPQLLLMGDPRDLEQVQVIVDQNTLFLSLGKGYPHYGTVSADIRGSVLNVFRYQGTGSIEGKQLETRYLELYLANQGRTELGGHIGLQRLEIVGSGLTQISGIRSYDLQLIIKGSPKVQLTGWANLRRLSVDGDAWLSLYWIKSSKLRVRATGAAKIQLAGAVNILDLELSDKAEFKGRYLRAQRSFVKTRDKSMAEIYSFNHQSTLATDNSDIYYYYIPNTRADFMAVNGSVLKLRPWNPYDFRDFTAYNKQFP